MHNTSQNYKFILNKQQKNEKNEKILDTFINITSLSDLKKHQKLKLNF